MGFNRILATAPQDPSSRKLSDDELHLMFANLCIEGATSSSRGEEKKNSSSRQRDVHGDKNNLKVSKSSNLEGMRRSANRSGGKLGSTDRQEVGGAEDSSNNRASFERVSRKNRRGSSKKLLTDKSSGSAPFKRALTDPNIKKDKSSAAAPIKRTLTDPNIKKDERKSRRNLFAAQKGGMQSERRLGSSKKAQLDPQMLVMMLENADTEKAGQVWKHLTRSSRNLMEGQEDLPTTPAA